jgi:hypothetical protein
VTAALRYGYDVIECSKLAFADSLHVSPKEPALEHVFV